MILSDFLTARPNSRNLWLHEPGIDLIPDLPTTKLRLKRAFPACTAAAFLSLSGAGRAEPVSVWAKNPHFFFWRGKPLVFITSP